VKSVLSMAFRLGQALRYSSIQLRSIFNCSTQKPVVEPIVWKKINECGIQKSIRGCKGGSRKQRKINVICGIGQRCAEISCGINKDNLLKIKLHGADDKKQKISVGQINARSVKNKTFEITNLLLDNDLDILAVTETWLASGNKDEFTKSEISPTGYTILDVSRSKGKGGGVAIISKTALQSKKQRTPLVKSFEIIESLITTSKEILRLGVIYRPPSGGKHGQPIATFMDEFQEYLDSRATMSGILLLLGDFNFHFEDNSNCDALKLKDLLSGLNMKQHVIGATHKYGHCLDLVITRSDEIDINDLLVHAQIISDHSAITFSLPTEKPCKIKKQIRYRKLKDIDVVLLQKDFEQCSFVTNPENDINLLAEQYNKCLSEILEQHAPLIEKNVVDRNDSLWFSEECKLRKLEKRQAERKWRNNKITVNLHMLTEAADKYKLACHSAKTIFLQKQISDCNKNQKELFKITNFLLHKEKKSLLPSHTDPKQLANSFVNFFDAKIQKIRETFTASSNFPIGKSITNTPTLSHFKSVTEEEVRKTILSTNNKHCHLDPIPTTLLKSCLECLLPSLTKLINTSIEVSTFPNTWKCATVTPLIKKQSLDVEEMKNFRPVSNLCYMSKIAEKIVLKQIDTHMEIYNLHEPNQSAYRSKHSTETALVKIVNDLLLAVDKRKCVMLVMLDMSAAFDTVDHSILLNRMESSFGITNEANNWLCSYFGNRSQSVQIRGAMSDAVELASGMPQGSILGPKGYPAYVSPIFRIAQQHGVSMHMYADDTQLYADFDVTNFSEVKNKMEKCIADIREWLSLNCLKLNDDKTELLIIGQPTQLNKIDKYPTITIGNTVVKSVPSARNIGAVLDCRLKMTEQVNSVCGSCYAGLRSLGKIRSFLTVESATILVHSFITCRLDNLNSLLIGLPGCLLQKLQRIQNHAARIVTRLHKHDSISSTLKTLHWLPIEERIDYKVILLTFKALNSLAPSYLIDMFHSKENLRSLRSSGQALLIVPQTRLITVGDRAFSAYAPKLWNSLPQTMREDKDLNSFKTNLKTYLFKRAFKSH